VKRRTAPLAPHIQIYRPQLTSVLSISHRVSGIALSLGSVLLVAWLVAAAAGPRAFSAVREMVHSPGGLFLLLLWTFSLFFHLCNGIRHLVWDTCRGFELRTIYLSGWSVIVSSIVLTGLAWVVSHIVAR
jgi:succinate dehydrogenase / fumarate reductase cytochrome b subunit